MPGTSTTPVVLIDNSPGIQPFWQPDTAGAKLFVIGSPRREQPDQGPHRHRRRRGASRRLDDNTVDGFMLDDGSAAIWQVGTRAEDRPHRGRREDAHEHREVDPRHAALDGKRMLFNSLDPVAPDDTVDIRSIDTTHGGAARRRDRADRDRPARRLQRDRLARPLPERPRRDRRAS